MYSTVSRVNMYIVCLYTHHFLNYRCIFKPRNSSCISNVTYLNYTNNVEYLLQLELKAMEYIEANVTNQYCRNYLKAALCTTIYPPCNDGAQKLCSEVCDSLLNNGTCSSDTKHLTEFVTNIGFNSLVKFTINCSDSLSFSSRFLSKMPCLSNKCISLTEIAETPTT